MLTAAEAATDFLSDAMAKGDLLAKEAMVETDGPPWETANAVSRRGQPSRNMR